MRSQRRWIGGWLLMSLALLVALGPSAVAQSLGGVNQHVQWTATAEPETVAPGGEVRVHLRTSITDGWKMYAVDSPPPSRGVRVHVDSLTGAVRQVGELLQMKPKEGYDPNFDKTVRYFEGEAEVAAQFAIEGVRAPSTVNLSGEVEFMICNDQMCLPPTRKPFSVAVPVRDGAVASLSEAPDLVPPADEAPEPEGTSEASEETATSNKGAAVSATGDLDAARRGGLWGFLLLAVGAGGAALLTPCVFPMIPLTVSYFTKHADNRSQAVKMASIYGLSIVTIFTGLGVLMAAVFGAAGAQTIAANPWVNFFIGAVFVFFALSLLGLFELRLPSGLVNYVNRQGTEQTGYMGVLFMGLTLTLVSFSCTAPFVGGLLAATSGGEWIYPVAGMLAFSTTFALPFVLFALFPNALDTLPQSGSWMNVVKVTLGFIELAAALKFLSNADLVWGTNLLSRPLAIAITVSIFILAGMYLLGKLRLEYEPPETVGTLRLLTAMAFLGTALYMVPGLFGAQLGSIDAYLPPRQASDLNFVTNTATGGSGSSTSNEELDWHVDDLDAALADGREQEKPVFVDFTGYTCTNCRDMEANVFTDPSVAQRFEEDFVLVRLYTDAQPKGPTFQRYQLRLTGTTALPTYAVIDPAEESLIDRVSGTMPADEFAAFLEQTANSFGDRQIAMR